MSNGEKLFVPPDLQDIFVNGVAKVETVQGDVVRITFYAEHCDNDGMFRRGIVSLMIPLVGARLAIDTILGAIPSA